MNDKVGGKIIRWIVNPRPHLTKQISHGYLCASYQPDRQQGEDEEENNRRENVWMRPEDTNLKNKGVGRKRLPACQVAAVDRKSSVCPGQYHPD